jgi:hypothetical protein
MLSITPCRRTVSDRFPVASFVVHVPPQRVFEVACTVDAQLFRPERRGQRTPENFYSSRAGGLLRAPAGQATWLLPSEQLRRFAGQRRLYFSVASFADAAGSSPEFTTGPHEIERAPWMSLSPDFTGRTLDRSLLRRTSGADPRYGAPGAGLIWGGDRSWSAPPAPPATIAGQQGYDDGYPDELWTRTTESDPADPPDETMSAQGEPPGFEDVPALRDAEEAEAYGRRSYGRRAPPVQRNLAEPPGLEHPPPRSAPQPARLGGAVQGARSVGTAREPPGAADPDELRRPQAAYGGSAHSEPPGVEEPRELRGRRYGDGAPAAQVTPAMPAPAAAKPSPVPPGVDDEYEDELGPDGEGELPEGYLASSLSILDKFRLAQPTAQLESGGDYTCVNPDGEFNDPTHSAYQRTHYGLHWGLMQLNQRSGALGRALVACERRDPIKFREAFGPERDRLLRAITADDEEARVRPASGQLVWQDPWLSRFREAGRIPEFQAAQNEVAIEGYFDPNLGFASALGFDSDRALAMLYDRCVDLGNLGGRKFVIEAVSPLKDDASVQSALKALGHDSPQSLQGSLGLAQSNTLGPKAHAALLQALRGLGATSPVKVPDLPAMLDALVAASRGRRFENRVAQMRNSTLLSDTRRSVS